MKAYGNIKNLEKGYCCESCDGPWRKWVKKTRRYMKKSERQKVKVQLKKI